MFLMSKGSKEALTVLIVTHITYVEGVKRSLNSFTHNFPNIQRIFNPQKVLCMLKHVEGVESQNNFQPFQHT